MRFAWFIAIFLLGVQARAQDQDRKLVQRLLEPDMKLQNSAQNKKFSGISDLTTASASTHQFYVPDRKLTRNFAGTHEFATGAFRSRSFATKTAYVHRAPGTRTFATKTARDVRAAREAPAKFPAREFAGTWPFLGRGKSQQALHAQDHPLSIDEIRELLNKNK
jgi:hypothetical protein